MLRQRPNLAPGGVLTAKLFNSCNFQKTQLKCYRPHRQGLQICRASRLSPAPENPSPAVPVSESAGEAGRRPRLNPISLHFGCCPSGLGGEDSTEACTWHPSHHTAPLVAVEVAGVFDPCRDIYHRESCHGRCQGGWRWRG